MADSGKFSALSNKVKEHAANAAAQAAENVSSGRFGNAAKPTTVGSSGAKPTTFSSASKPASAAKPTTTAPKPATTAAAAAAAAVAKPTTSAAASATKPTGTAAAPATSTKFTDVPSDAYYAEAVAWAVRKGIVSGTTETTFTPDNPCHRGHAATFIWRSKGSPKPRTTKNPFTDVSDGPFYQAILWASENGVVPGVTAATFDTQAPCTRAQVLTYLMRAFSKADATESDAIKWAATKRLLTGLSGNASSPCTRADMVTFLYRVQGK